MKKSICVTYSTLVGTMGTTLLVVTNLVLFGAL